MKEAIKISAAIAAALLLAGCAKKQEAPAPEPTASAPVEMAPAEAAPVETAPAEAAPMSEGFASDAAAMPGDAAASAAAEGDDTDRAGGDKVAPQ